MLQVFKTTLESVVVIPFSGGKERGKEDKTKRQIARTGERRRYTPEIQGCIKRVLVVESFRSIWLYQKKISGRSSFIMTTTDFLSENKIDFQILYHLGNFYRMHSSYLLILLSHLLIQIELQNN